MKILHVIPSIDKVRGGPSESIIDLVDSLNKSGQETELLTTFSDDPNFVPVDYSRIKEKVHLLPRKQFLFYEQYVPILKSWLMNNVSKYKVIHIHSVFNYTSYVAMTCARRKRVPYVLRTLGHLNEYDLRKKGFLKKFWLNFVDINNLNLVSAFQSTSNSETNEIKKLFPFAKVEAIPHGIRLPVLSFKAEVKDIKLLFISRLHKKKNIPAILEAISRAVKGGISINLKIAGEPNPGDEEYKNYLIKIVQDLNIQNHVEFCGFLSGQAKEDSFRWADVFVLPSFDENFGVAVMEALSYSVPVIISPQVALSKEVREFGGGWITDEKNPQSADSVLEILERIHQNKNLILEESKKARLVAERFSWENNSRALISLYKSILDEKLNK